MIGAGLATGGQEKHRTDLANMFAKHGNSVVLINLFKTEVFFELEKNIVIIWPEIEREKHHRLIYAFRIASYLRKNIKAEKPNIVLSFGEWCNHFVILSTRFLHVPLFIFELMGPSINLGWLIDASRKLTYKYADGVVAQTNTAAEIIRKKTGATNICVIPNLLIPINSDTSLKKKQILTVGRLSLEKGHIILIRAFSKLLQKDWILHIVGDGPERSNLEKESAILGITDRIVVHGYLNDLTRILGESEIFVLPSFYEGFPNALLEAMSVPIACISSDCIAGPSDIINHGVNGLLVEPGNVEALASSLNRLIENPGLRRTLASNAYEVRRTFSFDKISQLIFRFIS